MEPLLQVRGLHKAYNVPVLVDFDLDLHKGEIHALMGSNGAGKSTLAKILCGLTPCDSGEILLDSRPHHPRSKQEASAAGVVLVLQELNVIPTLSIAENLFFHRLPSRWGVVSRNPLRAKAKEALAKVQLQHLEPDSPAGELGVGQQQLLEIAAALAQDCRLLILDEPTAALTEPEIETLFSQMKALANRGVALLYVSHRMAEIRRIAHRVTVMRDGQRISTHNTKEVSTQTLVREMAGKDVWSRKAERRDLSNSPIALEARHIAAPPLVQDLNLQLRRGEILGLSGLVGSGRTESLRALFGVDPIASGEYYLHGKRVRFRHPREAVDAGLGMVPEDRKKDGLLLSHSIRSNATLATMDRYSRLGYVFESEETNAASDGCERLDIKRNRLEQAVEELSGGNQQKVVMLRWLLRESDILLLDEPTRGIDVAAKEGIYTFLRELAAKGRSLLVVSSELLELMALCDRIVVLSGGRIAREFASDDWSQEALTEAAFSSYIRETSAPE